MEVEFIDESTGDITKWEWDFGDGTTSTEQNPTHIYKDLLTYTVTLTVTGPAGTDTKTESDLVTVKEFELSVTCGPEVITTYAISGGYAMFLNKRIEGFTFLPIASGSMAGIRLTAGGEADGVWGFAGQMDEMWTGSGVFAEAPVKGDKPLYAWAAYPNFWHFVARADLGISMVDEIVQADGISFGSPVYTFHWAYRDVVTAWGLWDEIEPKHKNLKGLEYSAAWTVGEVQAGWGKIEGLTGVSSTMAEIDLNVDVVALDWTEEQRAALADVKHLFYHDLPAHPCWAQDVALDPIPSFVTPYGWAFSPHVPPDVMYRVMKTLWEGEDELAAISPGLLGWWVDNKEQSLADTVAVNPDLPWHPGAVRLYREVGIWNEEWLEGECIP